MQCSRCCLRSTEQRGIIISLNWLARLLVIQPRMMLVIFAARAGLVHIQLAAYKVHQVFFSRVAPQTVSPQHVSLQGVLPSQMQDFVFVHVKFHKDLVSPSCLDPFGWQPCC